jgi:hypothetical protein
VRTGQRHLTVAQTQRPARAVFNRHLQRHDRVELLGLAVPGISVHRHRCTDQRPETGAYNTPIQDKYQPPKAEAAEPLGEEWMTHPSEEGNEQERGLGGSAPDTQAGEAQ